MIMGKQSNDTIVSMIDGFPDVGTTYYVCMYCISCKLAEIWAFQVYHLNLIWPSILVIQYSQWMLRCLWRKVKWCLVHLLTQNLFWAHSNFLSVLKIILVYSKVRFYYINWLIWVYLNIKGHSNHILSQQMD